LVIVHPSCRKKGSGMSPRQSREPERDWAE
jgi:hypothetical protein